MIYLIFISFLLPVFAQEFSPIVDPNKFTVCAITINSDEEKKVFESQIKKYPKKFNPIVELTSLGSDEDWFRKACASGIRCDQLIISGHFGGTFFGSSGKTLPLTQLEKAGCSKSCEGIMSQPYEVFLFGCNTLATKEQDHRTPAEYLQVLLEDGIPAAQAQMVVESRYGALGDDNISSMKRAFDGEAKQLYGFHSVGPSGKNIEKFLKNYFAKTKIIDRLEKLQGQRIVNQVSMSNEVLAQELSVTAFAQCGAGGNKELDPKTKIICDLRNENLSVDLKLKTVVDALNHENYLVFIPAINAFLKEHPIDTFTEEQKKDFAIIKDNEKIKQQIAGLLDASSIGLVLEWSKFAQSLGLINQEERNQYISKKVNKIFEKPLDEGTANTMLSLFFSFDSNERDYKVEIDEEVLLKRELNKYDVGALSVMEIESQKIKEKLRKNRRLTKECGLIMGIMAIKPYEEKDMKEIGEFLDNKKEAIDCGLFYLSRRDLPDNILEKLFNLIGSDPAENDSILMAINSSGKNTPETYLKIKQLLLTKKLNPSFIYSFINKTSSAESINFVLDLIRPEYVKNDGEGFANYVFGALIQNKLKSNDVVSQILDKLSFKSSELDPYIFDYMKKIGEVDKSMQLKMLKNSDPNDYSHRTWIQEIKFSQDPEVQAALATFYKKPTTYINFTGP